MTVCAIHQPTFLPWLGYFDKIAKADTFVFLDRADYQKSSKSMGSWCNRVAINVNGTSTWISAAVVREHGPQPIHTVRLDDGRPWRDAIRKTLETSYRRARHFASAFELIDRLLAFETAYIADFNINAIEIVAAHLGVDARYVRESALPSLGTLSTQRLIDIVKAVGADAYLCGAASADYLDMEAFPTAGLRLLHQRFTPEPYGPPEQFMPGLSVIDYLMHCG